MYSGDIESLCAHTYAIKDNKYSDKLFSYIHNYYVLTIIHISSVHLQNTIWSVGWLQSTAKETES